MTKARVERRFEADSDNRFRPDYANALAKPIWNEPAHVTAKKRIQRRIDKGILDEQGKVRNNVRFVARFAGMVAVEPVSNGRRIEHLRCLKPACGLPGGATIDVSRESLAQISPRPRLHRDRTPPHEQAEP